MRARGPFRHRSIERFHVDIVGQEQAFEAELNQHGGSFAEAVSMFPSVEHGGPKEHLFWLKEARKAVKMPLIASLNAVQSGTW